MHARFGPLSAARAKYRYYSDTKHATRYSSVGGLLHHLDLKFDAEAEPRLGNKPIPNDQGA